MADFKLGPLQEAWSKSLEKHPERQMKNKLGERTGDTYLACCLGVAGLIAGVLEWDTVDNLCVKGAPGEITALTNESYLAIGLRSPTGTPYDQFSQNSEEGFHALSYLNDNGSTWPEIAAILREHPEQYFTEPK